MPGTRLISGRDLRRLTESLKKQHGSRRGGRMAVEHLREALDLGHLRPKDFSIRDLCEAFIPDAAEWLGGSSKSSAEDLDRLLEGGDGASAVGYSDFSNITGQIFFTEVKDAYEDEEFVFSREIESKASSIQDIEKIPGISRIGQQEQVVEEGQPYPFLGVSEDYQEVAYKRKRGAIIPVTKEAVRGDKTGVLLERCSEEGHFLGLQLEMRVIDAIIDQNAGATSAYQGGHRYTWKGTAYGTYQTSTPWINVQASNALVDETNLDTAWQLQAKITDPYTGLPILVPPTCLIVAPQLAWKASRILGATEFRNMNPGYETSGSPSQTVSAPAVNRMLPGLKTLTSRLLYSRMNTASETTSDWFLANLRKGVRRYYNWDITASQRGTGTDAEFYRDVVLEWRADLKDTVSVYEPRVMLKNTA